MVSCICGNMTTWVENTAGINWSSAGVAISEGTSWFVSKYAVIFQFVFHGMVARQAPREGVLFGRMPPTAKGGRNWAGDDTDEDHSLLRGCRDPSPILSVGETRAGLMEPTDTSGLEKIKRGLQRYLSIKSSYSPQFSPDDGVLAFLSDLTGVPQVWTTGLRGNQWPQQLSLGAERVGFLSSRARRMRSCMGSMQEGMSASS